MRLANALFALTLLAPGVALAQSPPPDAPLDVREAPFSVGDFTWMHGSNYQPASPLRLGPVTASFYVDAFYAWQFARPIDETIFVSTTAPRHGELGINLAYLGLELSGIDTPAGGPIGRLEVQFGSTTEAVQGQDSSTARGLYLASRALQYLKQATAGWHFHVLHGLNLEAGVFPSYIGLDSYLPQENWCYTHPFLSDFTPYYLTGVRAQLHPSQNVRIEAWLVNGWQTFGRWGSTLAGGYSVHGRPSENVALTHLAYAGQDQPSDPDAVRFYSDNSAMLRVWHDHNRRWFQSLAFALVGDLGYERRGPAAGTRGLPPSGIMAGAALSARIEWTRTLMSTLRGDVYYDASAAVVTPLPAVTGYTLPGNGSAENPFAWLGAGLTATFDWRPSPWLLVRVEYAHRAANQPYFSGRGGITGPDGVPPVDDAARAAWRPDLRRTDDRVIANVTLRM